MNWSLCKIKGGKTKNCVVVLLIISNATQQTRKLEHNIRALIVLNNDLLWLANDKQYPS